VRAVSAVTRADALERHRELVRRDLHQRRADALPQLRLAGEDRDGASRAYADP
jgi:hypothetical protein